jgi:hypothetical protein
MRTSGIGAALMLVWIGGAAAQPLHTCDAIGDEGWRAVATQEIASVKDGAPFDAGSDWVVERTTRLLPLCNYVNAVGNYSLRSYSLDPIEKTERVVICRAGAPVEPYRGPCPPR